IRSTTATVAASIRPDLERTVSANLLDQLTVGSGLYATVSNHSAAIKDVPRRKAYSDTRREMKKTARAETTPITEMATPFSARSRLQRHIRTPNIGSSF